MSDTDATTPDADPMHDADAWQALSPDEQDEYLDEGLARLKGDQGDGHWRHLSDAVQRQTTDAIEGQHRDDDADLSEAEKAMQEALGTTWTAELWGHTEDVPTVPLECRELSDREQDIMTDGFRLMAAIDDQADEADDIDDIAFDSEYFDSIGQFERWLFAFLADVTDDDAFDEDRFRSGTGLRSGTRQELLAAIFFRYEEEARNAQKFRQEQER